MTGGRSGHVVQNMTGPVSEERAEDPSVIRDFAVRDSGRPSSDPRQLHSPNSSNKKLVPLRVLCVCCCTDRR